MTVFWILLIAALALFGVWLFMIAPRLGGPADTHKLLAARYAHRGLHNIKAGVPENSMKAFALAVEQGYGIELDVHLSKDGRLVVEHDDTLTRTTGDPRKIEDCNWEEIQALTLENTTQTLPLLTDVLDLVDGRVPLLVEMKAVGGNMQALAREVARVMGDYKGPYCVESFEPRALYWLGKADPTVFRGQLAGHVRKDGAKVSPLIDFLLRNLLVNVISRPDFVAYDYRDRHNLSFRLCRSLFRPPLFFWTVRSVEGANISAAAKATPIFEGLDGWTL